MNDATEPLVEIDADEILNPPSIFSALTACKESRRMSWEQLAAEWKAFSESPLFLALRDEVKISARRALSQLVVDPEHPCGKVPGSKELWTGVNLGHTYHLELLKKIPNFLDAQMRREAQEQDHAGKPHSTDERQRERAVSGVNVVPGRRRRAGRS